VFDIGTKSIYDPEAWEPGSFVINISGNAVTKHEVNHGDSTNFSEGSEDVITEVTFGDDGSGIVRLTGFETQPSCDAHTP